MKNYGPWNIETKIGCLTFEDIRAYCVHYLFAFGISTKLNFERHSDEGMAENEISINI